jgi:hypothetical protein
MGMSRRFKLYALLAIVLIACIPIGLVSYELNWMHARHSFLRLPLVHVNSYTFGSLGPPPWPLNLFGERGVYQLMAPTSMMQQARELFPEATVDRSH